MYRLDGNGMLLHESFVPLERAEPMHRPRAFGHAVELRRQMTDTADRRGTKRFPIELPAELYINKYRLDEKTLNISSAGLLMTCSREGVSPGMRVRVCISWPPMREKTKMMLMRRGRVVWSQSGKVAIQWKRSKSLTLTAAELAKVRTGRKPRRSKALSAGL
jgi:hypothetical protein